MFEVLAHHRPQIEASDVLSRLQLDRHGYFLVSAHREENVDSERNLLALTDALNAIAETYAGCPVLVSTHPRTRKRIDAASIVFHPSVLTMKPFGFIDYNALQMAARVTLSDSGTISEESAILNFPALNIREAHERPEAMEEGSVMMVGVGKERILQGLEILAHQQRDEDRLLRLPADYAAPNVSDKVLRIILSYTDYVQRVVWRRFDAGSAAH